VAFAGCHGLREELGDEIVGKSWPSGEVAWFDCSEKSREGGAENGTAEESGQVRLCRSDVDGTASEVRW
jgi:hypothetical protein